MAIIRCPYCHAIIDENDKYCNNCGTQLLFSEDESIEEEIPGEKIIDAETDEEEKDYEIDEPGKETTGAPEEDDGTKEETAELAAGAGGEAGSKDIGRLIDEEASGEGEESEPEGEGLQAGEDKTEEVILVDEIAAREAAAKEEGGSARKELPAEETEEPAAGKKSPEEETRAYPVEPVKKEEPGEETAELAAPPVPVPSTFDTRELEGMGKTVDLGKERVDKLIEVMAEKQKEEKPREEASKPEPEKRTGTLPPWADRIRSSASVVEREDTRDVGPGRLEETPAVPAEKFGETGEEEIFPHRKASDSGIGLPERVTQATLPFGPAGAGKEEGEEAGEEETLTPAPAAAAAGLPKREGTRPLVRGETRAEAGFEKEPEEEEPRPPFHLSIFLKAKAFDILFIGVFWLVALWVAARSMDATLFELLSVTSGSVLLLYAVFILLYLFLFKFFLGETLGDRLFKERE
jgi:hypothetical protein